jgi:hypothetical protein
MKWNNSYFNRKQQAMRKHSEDIKQLATRMADGMAGGMPFAIVDVQHDDTCSIFRNGQCNCSPDMFQHHHTCAYSKTGQRELCDCTPVKLKP